MRVSEVHSCGGIFSYNELQVNLRHILSLSHFSASTLKSVFGNLGTGLLMPAGTKSLAVGKPFRVLLLVASPGLYTACPGWSTLGSSCLCYESEMRNAGTRTHMHIFLLLLHARQVALCSGTAGQTDSDSGAANRLQVAQIWAPGPKSQTCSFPSFSFPFTS